MEDQTLIADLRRRLAETEAALAESEARFAATLDSVPVGVAMLDRNGRIVVSNSHYQRFCPTGTMPSNDPERQWRWRGWHADGRPLAVDDYPGRRALRGESVVPGQEMLYRDDTDAEIWVRVATVPIRDAAGAVVGQASVVSDIDTLKRSADSLLEAERRQAFLLRLSDAIRTAADPVAIEELGVTLVARQLGVDRCVFSEWVVEAGAEWLVVGGEYRVPEAPSFIGRHPPAHLGDDLAVLRTGQVVRVEGDEEDPRHPHLRSRLIVPLLRQGRLAATLGLSQQTPRQWSAGDVMLACESAARIAAAVEQARIELRLSDTHAEFREVQARAQVLVDGIAVATWETPPDGRVTVDSPSWRAFTGQTVEQWAGFGWLDAVHPDDRVTTMRVWRTCLRRREPVDLEYRLRSRHGGYRWMNARAIPLVDDAGVVQKWLGMNIDIDVRKRLEQAVLDNERRMRAMVEGVPQLLWRAVLAGSWSWASPQWTVFTGQPEEESHGDGWLRHLHPDDRDAVLRAWARAQRSGGFDVEHRLRHVDGSYRWFSTRAVPVRDESGWIVEWLGSSNDIDALRQAQDRQGVLVAELQHRTRNLIAVVRSLCERTLDGAASLEAFEQRFNDRLSALARVQSLLSHATAGQRVTFGTLLRSELAALGVIEGDRIDPRVTLDGPDDVPLRSGAVQTLALALHELATNAVKYGALRTDAGRLAIDWRVERDETRVGWLCVDWHESGVVLSPAAADPQPRGYGRELIERALPYQLGARTRYAFAADGVRCSIAVAVVSGQASEE